MAKKELDAIAGVSIVSPHRALFYLQEKDEGHPIPEFRNKYAFFGGKVEKGETLHEAAQRELEEELTPRAAALVIPQLQFLFSLKIRHTYALPKQEDYG